jgi:Sulfotransferase family
MRDTSADLQLETLTLAPDNGARGQAPETIRYVCIPGSPFTGSTLLGTLLNEHPDCASIGAAVGLHTRADLSTYRCSCGRLFRECEFWQAVAERTRRLGHPVDVFQTDFWNTYLRLSSNRWINVALVRSLGWSAATRARDAVLLKAPAARKSIAKMGWNSWSLATAVLAETGKRVFVDTSRDHQRPKYLAMHPRLDVKVIHLVRDPRGNVASIIKHTGADAATAARQWKRYNVEAARVRQYLPAASWMSLRYEDLCADPAAALDRIAEFLGTRRVQPEQGSLPVEAHIIGNKARLRGRSEIREDRSWQTTLRKSDLDRIAQIAGSTSHSLGYQWP